MEKTLNAKARHCMYMKFARISTSRTDLHKLCKDNKPAMMFPHSYGQKWWIVAVGKSWILIFIAPVENYDEPASIIRYV